jgi:hypothetical protein
MTKIIIAIATLIFAIIVGYIQIGKQQETVGDYFEEIDNEMDLKSKQMMTEAEEKSDL